MRVRLLLWIAVAMFCQGGMARAACTPSGLEEAAQRLSAVPWIGDDVMYDCGENHLLRFRLERVSRYGERSGGYPRLEASGAVDFGDIRSHAVVALNNDGEPDKRIAFKGEQGGGVWFLAGCGQNWLAPMLYLPDMEDIALASPRELAEGGTAWSLPDLPEKDGLPEYGFAGNGYVRYADEALVRRLALFRARKNERDGYTLYIVSPDGTASRKLAAEDIRVLAVPDGRGTLACAVPVLRTPFTAHGYAARPIRINDAPFPSYVLPEQYRDHDKSFRCLLLAGQGAGLAVEADTFFPHNVDGVAAAGEGATAHGVFWRNIVVTEPYYNDTLDTTELVRRRYRFSDYGMSYISERWAAETEGEE